LEREDGVIWINSNMLYAEKMLHDTSERLGWRARRFIESSSLAVIARIAANGGGAALLPKTVKYAFANELVAIPNTPSHTDHICLIWRHDASQSAAAKVIRDRIMASIKSIPHEPNAGD
jgi:DNA-binding transcriptional LysR family regulator